MRYKRLKQIALILLGIAPSIVQVNAQTVTDKDGNVYTTVTIGTQEWMAENLKTTKYKDGTDIPLVDSTEWGYALNTPAYCWYKNDIAYKNTYGALYNWYTVTTGKICPTGWHVPSDAEWTTLTDYLGGKSDAGGKLKETGTTHWNSPNTAATNKTGFTALPGGICDFIGTFGLIGLSGDWWSASEYSTTDILLATHAYYRGIVFNLSGVYRNFNSKQAGLSVRCIRD